VEGAAQKAERVDRHVRLGLGDQHSGRGVERDRAEQQAGGEQPQAVPERGLGPHALVRGAPVGPGGPAGT